MSVRSLAWHFSHYCLYTTPDKMFGIPRPLRYPTPLAYVERAKSSYFTQKSAGFFQLLTRGREVEICLVKCPNGIMTAVATSEDD